jgi:hypothetical protein
MIMVIVVALGVPLVVAFNKRAERRDLGSATNPESDRRLERIEQAIEAMAVEVERISEGQRFVTKLLSERTPRDAIRAEQRSGT